MSQLPQNLVQMLPPELLQQLPPGTDPAEAIQSALAGMPPQMQQMYAQMAQMQSQMQGQMPQMPQIQQMQGQMAQMPQMQGLMPQMPQAANPFQGPMPPELQQMMASLQSGNLPKGSMVALSFNNMMVDFLQNLKQVFPELTELDLAIKGMEVAVKIDPMEPINGWKKAMEKLGEAEIEVNGEKKKFEQPYFAERTPERVKAFLEMAPKLPFIEMIPIVDMYNDVDIDEEDRQDVWDHLHQLELIALAINAFDANTLGAIERVAGRCMNKIVSMGPDAQNIDVKSLGMDVVREMMSDSDLKEAMEKADEKQGSGGGGGFGEEALMSMLQGPLGQNMGLGNLEQFRGQDGQFDPSAFAQQFGGSTNF